jgi:very-short-patch-repair endonuclease
VKDLPQVCCRCRLLKVAELGRFFVSRHRHGVRRWICAACDAPEAVPRLRRHGHESHAEARVRRTLALLQCRALAEYPLGPYIYDFAIPRLRLLIEVDSKQWHRAYDRRRRDRQKDSHASSEQWTLVRITVGPDLERNVAQVVARQRSALGL